MKLADEFKQFLLRGNLVELAVAIVIGVAFGDVVKAMVSDFITPVIAAVFGKPDFGGLSFTLNGSRFAYGHFFNQLLSFVIIAAVIFFLVVKPVNYLIARSHREPPPDPTMRNCPFCVSAIPVQATRCSFCTSEVAKV